MAIARALLADPAVLMLDEAMTVLGRTAEARLADAHAKPSKAAPLLIRHCPSLLERADRVVGLVGRGGGVAPRADPSGACSRGEPSRHSRP